MKIRNLFINTGRAREANSINFPCMELQPSTVHVFSRAYEYPVFDIYNTVRICIMFLSIFFRVLTCVNICHTFLRARKLLVESTQGADCGQVKSIKTFHFFYTDRSKAALL